MSILLARSCLHRINQPLPHVAPGLNAMPRRTQSMPQQSELDTVLENVFGDHDGRDELLRDRPPSPIRANSKRRRSVISQVGESSRKRQSISRFEYVDLGSGSSGGHSRCTSRSDHSFEEGGSHAEHGDVSHHLHSFTRDGSHVQSRSREQSSDREPSRGRTRRRKISLIAEDIRHTDSSHGINLQQSASNRRGLGRYSPTSYSNSNMKYGVLSQAVDPAPDLQSSTVRKGAYLTKGNFRLRNQDLTKFYYPKSQSSPEPAWYAGDGFTASEAKPELLLRIPGKLRGKSSRLLPALGQLVLEQDSASEHGQSSVTLTRPRSKPLAKPHYFDAEEDWPTKQVFYEVDQQSNKRSKPNIARKRSLMLEEEPRHPVLSQKSDPKNNPILLRKRQRSHFEKFGRRQRRLDSGHEDTLAHAYADNHLWFGPLPLYNNADFTGYQDDEPCSNESTKEKYLDEEKIRDEGVNSPLHSSQSDEDAEFEDEESEVGEEMDDESMGVSHRNDPTSEQQDEKPNSTATPDEIQITHACNMSLELSVI
ncbi:hypothetical protein GGR57DRAFT_127705 [Xylariaceae sp. FL1272]|nr:hypothetical protein GGR57DRAFT_127705 [Xylariaceae sp. FL1272]